MNNAEPLIVVRGRCHATNLPHVERTVSVDPSLLPDIEARVSILESAVHELVANVEAKYGKPDLFEVGGHPRTRYPWAMPVHARVLKAVRVVSAPHAVNTLLARISHRG